MNDDITPKRGRPASTPQQSNASALSLRNTVALAVLQGIITYGSNVSDKEIVMRYCFELADAFIEESDAS
jgi:hypothetical protein